MSLAETHGKNIVFLTGVTGFVGRYLLYQLCAADWVDEVYVLIRPKKGKTPQERFREMLSGDVLFETAREKEGVSFDSVTCVAGDIEKPDLKMSPEVLEVLSDKITLVIHNAAALSFAQNLQAGFKSNTTGAWDLYNKCKIWRHKPALLVVSTIATNSHLKVVPEKVTRFSTDASTIYNYINTIPEERVLEQQNWLKEGRLDGYAFSKGIMEAMILEDIEQNGGVVPVAFVRPGGIICALNGPVPGWLHETCFYAQLGYFVYKGKVPFFLADRKNDINMAPVDVIGNLICATSLDLLEKRERKEFTAQVVNGSKCCVSGLTFDVILGTTQKRWEDYKKMFADGMIVGDEITPADYPPRDPMYIKWEWAFELLFNVVVFFPLWLYSLWHGAEHILTKRYVKLTNFLYKYVKVLKPYLTKPIQIESGYDMVLHNKYGTDYPIDCSHIDTYEFCHLFISGIARYILPAMERKQKRIFSNAKKQKKA